MIDASLRRLIIRYFQERVNQAPMENELRRALKVHERVPLFIDNMARELSRVKGLTVTHVRDVTESMTDFFIETVKAHTEQRLLSPSEVQRLNFEYQQKRLKELEAEMSVREEKAKIDTRLKLVR